MASTRTTPHLVRRALFWLVTLALTVLAGCSDSLPGADEGLGESSLSLISNTRIRLMGANISSGNNQSYDPGHGVRIFQGVHPDIAMIQEFNYGTNSTADIRSFVDTAFGPTFSYFREAGAQIPNGIISRFPIIASGEWDDTSVTNRDFAWARIDIPGPVDLWAISVHLLTTNSSVRATEAKQLLSLIQQNVPAGDFLVIAGDFNTSSRSEACVTTLSQVVVTSGPYPADRNSNVNTNASRGSPYDWVLVDPDLGAYKTPVVIGGSSFANGLVADTRVYTPIAELSPALSTDSGAANMQHMGVVRDFLIPGDAAASVAVTSPNGGESWATGSAQSITWTSAGVTNVKLESTLDGSTWAVIAPSVAASTGTYAWTVPGAVSSTAKVRVSDASNASVTDTSDGVFSITSAGVAKVFLNEILANELGADTNGEFIEIVNAGTASADLGGFTLSDAVSTRHTFAGGTILGAGKAIVVFGSAAAIPAGVTNAVACSTGTLSLSNGGDTVTLKDNNAVTVDSFTYASSLASTDGVSMNRSPDGSATGSFVLHTSLSASASSPGQQVNGSAF